MKVGVGRSAHLTGSCGTSVGASSLLGIAFAPALVGLLSLFPRTALAIDAANFARPATYMWATKASPESDDARDLRLRESQGSSTQKTTPGAAKGQANKPGTVQMTASGKPFVTVPSNAKCVVNASSAVSLEDQLRACARLPTPRVQ